MRVHPAEQRVCTPQSLLRWVLVWMFVCFIVFTVGPPSHWRLKDTQSSCPPCDCHCSSTEYSLHPLDCGKHDPAMNEEMNKDLLTMLSEELSLQKIVANETLEHTKRLIMDARKSFSHYQKEAESAMWGLKLVKKQGRGQRQSSLKSAG